MTSTPLAAALLAAAFIAPAHADNWNTHSYGNSTSAYGTIEGQQFNSTTNHYGNHSSTYGTIGGEPFNANTSRYGDTETTTIFSDDGMTTCTTTGSVNSTTTNCW